MKVNCYKLEEVNAAIDDLRHGRLTGSVVIVVDESLLLCVCFQCSFLFTSSFPLHNLPKQLNTQSSTSPLQINLTLNH